MPRAEKVEVVENIKKFLGEAGSIFITDYTGLNVEEITQLRKNLRDNQVKYVVAKNTLMRIAAKEAGFENIIPYFTGQTAIAFSMEDPVTTAKILYDSYKDIEKPEIRAFMLRDEEVYPGKEITRLADLPPREVLLARVIAAVESPITAVVMSLDAVMQNFVMTIDALAKAKAEEG